MASIEAQIGTGAYRSDRLRRPRARRRTGWLATFALILAEAVLAIALVIAGVTLFAKVKIASQTLGDLRAAGPLLEPRLIRPPAITPVEETQVPLSDRRVETIVAVAESPAARADAPPAATISIVGRGDVAAFGGYAVAVVAEAQIVPAPIVQTIAMPAPVEEPPSVAAPPPGAPPTPAEQSDVATIVSAPGAEEPETTVAVAEPPHPVAAVAVEPPAAPPSAIEVRPEETAPIANPGPVATTAAVPDPARVRRKPAAKPRHIAKKPRPHVHVAAKHPHVRHARASVTPPTTTRNSTPAPRSINASSTPSSIRYFQDR